MSLRAFLMSGTLLTKAFLAICWESECYSYFQPPTALVIFLNSNCALFCDCVSL